LQNHLFDGHEWEGTLTHESTYFFSRSNRLISFKFKVLNLTYILEELNEIIIEEEGFKLEG